MEKVIISAEFVKIHCYIGSKKHLFETFTSIQEGGKDKSDIDNIKIVFMVHDLSLK
jgi:hypothetical protein